MYRLRGERLAQIGKSQKRIAAISCRASVIRACGAAAGMARGV
jgi:hypothetical protein